ncbi:MAG: DUF2892 domain-containing protein [Anaerolineae bacterium]|nr:DUF2892 domain-containing protein [Thermoflexales bacterium]MDW8409004.1 DUF2892 domain-containing protein [Anaerolineae bacterium]
MKQNVGTVDRVVRVVIGLVLGLLVLTGQVSGVLAIVLGIAGVALLATAAIGFCGLYTVLGISTCPRKAQ